MNTPILSNHYGKPEIKRAKMRLLLLVSCGLVCLVLFRITGSHSLLSLYLPDFPGDKEFSGIVYYFILSFLFMFLIPVMMVRRIMKIDLRTLGLQYGERKKGVIFVLLFLPVIIGIFIYPASRMSVFQAAYPLFPGAGEKFHVFLFYELLYGLYYFSYEFFYRGYLLFGMKEYIGSTWSLLFQIIPSTVMHIGKPVPEIVSCIPAGIFFGLIAFKTRSFLYVFIIHWFIGIMLDTFIVF